MRTAPGVADNIALLKAIPIDQWVSKADWMDVVYCTGCSVYDVVNSLIDVDNFWVGLGGGL